MQCRKSVVAVAAIPSKWTIKATSNWNIFRTISTGRMVQFESRSFAQCWNTNQRFGKQCRHQIRRSMFRKIWWNFYIVRHLLILPQIIDVDFRMLPMFTHYRSQRSMMVPSCGIVHQPCRAATDATCPVNRRLSFRRVIVRQYDADRPFTAAAVCHDRHTPYRPHRHKQKYNEPYPASTLSMNTTAWRPKAVKSIAVAPRKWVV